MHPVISGNGEIPLLSDNSKVVAFDGLEQWQIDQLTSPVAGDSCSSSNNCLINIDSIVYDWIHQLKKEDWDKIKRQNSLFGIKLPDNWIKVWRFILKEKDLRDAERATRGGRHIGSFTHLWNIWSEDCIDRYLSDMEKELLEMVDEGYIYSEIGDILLGKYGDDFWKPRKENSKTTTSQVVNNYLYWKMPNKIARGELTDFVISRIKNKRK